MKALITGASSGIGKDMAYILSKMNYDLILVARSIDKLEEIKKDIKTNVTLYQYDLSDMDNCYKLYDNVKNEDIDIIINNAGFGVFGSFDKTNIDRELEMINLNIKAVHILTKIFLKDFKKKNEGYILNVASSAAFLPGPLMASYYASKAYVLHLTEALYEELRRDKSNVYVGVLCPGPVDTNFNNVAGVKFGVKAMNSNVVASYAIKCMFKKKLIIIPGMSIKLIYYFGKILPLKYLLKVTYNIQKAKEC